MSQNQFSKDKLLAIRQAVKEIQTRNRKAQDQQGKKEPGRDLAMVVYSR